MLQQCHWRNWHDITLHLGSFTVCWMLNGITHTEVEIQNTVPPFIQQFLGNSPKIRSQLFFKNLLVNGSGEAGCFIL